MANDSMILNTLLPPRRYSRPYAITPSDTVTDKNLQQNGIPFKWIQNTGSSGAVPIAWEPDATVVTVYLAQGQEMELGYAQHVKSTGLGAGVVIIGFRGIEGVQY